MDLTRLAVDAGQFINRAIQYTGETIGQAEKTDLAPGLDELLTLADATKTCTDKIISQTEVLLQPSAGARLEDRLYEQLEWSAPLRPRALEVLGTEMTQAGLEMGSNTPYGAALLRCGEAQKQLSDEERKFVQSTNIHFLAPLKSFTEGEYKAIQDERRMLLNKRLDLDVAKNRLRRAHEAEQESRSLNANPLDDNYLSSVSYMFSFLRVKWLKAWAQEISQAEMELRIFQSLFDRQSEITRQHLEGINNTHMNHMRSLTDFVEAQASYFDQCNQHAQELQRQLASIPTVLCSNVWQSEISAQASTSHQASNPPTAVHQIPDFDQDSWTQNPSTAAAKINSSVTAQPADPTHNNNNNNNNSSINSSDSREIRYLTETNQPAAGGESTAAVTNGNAISITSAQTANGGAGETVATSGESDETVGAPSVVSGGGVREASPSAGQEVAE